MTYHHLSERERYQIELYLQDNFSLRKIARILKRSASTKASRFIVVKQLDLIVILLIIKKINKFANRKSYKLKGKLLKEVKFLLKKKFSPEQISGHLWLKKSIRISHRAIYNWIYHKAENKEIYKKELRFVSKNRQKNKRGKVHIPERVGIEKREDKAKLAQQIGHLECDTILSKGNKTAVSSLRACAAGVAIS